MTSKDAQSRPCPCVPSYGDLVGILAYDRKIIWLDVWEMLRLVCVGELGRGGGGGRSG